MLTRCVRLHGVNDLRLETIDLPEIRDDEILVKNISDSLCMSSYKTALQGAKHKRVPDDVAENPIIIGHECCGEIVKVGKKWQDRFAPGDRYALQPAFNYKGTQYSPGYSFPHTGGDSQYAVIIPEIIEQDCLLKYNAPEFFYGSLAEPLSCIIGAFHAQYHTHQGVYVHDMDIKEGGCMAILGGTGPMGLGAVDYAIHRDRRPSVLVVTDINPTRLERAASIYTVEEAAKMGVTLHYVDSSAQSEDSIKALTGGKGFDDVFVFTPTASVIESADRLLAHDGCLNFFAGPVDSALSANFNFYNVHYAAHHVVGTSGGNTDDMREALSMFADRRLNPAGMITHIGGLNCVVEATLHLPEIPGGKKLVYPQIDLPLTAIDDFAEKGANDPLFAALDEICKRHNGLWSGEAEQYLLANAPKI